MLCSLIVALLGNFIRLGFCNLLLCCVSLINQLLIPYRNEITTLHAVDYMVVTKGKRKKVAMTIRLRFRANKTGLSLQWFSY